MRKPAPIALSVLLATLLAALLLPASAFADESEAGDESEAPSKQDDVSIIQKQETEDKHREIEGIYKNPGRISLPPIVIRPQSAGKNFIAVSPKISSTDVNGVETDIQEKVQSTFIDPVSGATIDIGSFSPTQKSPAESFMEVAYFGLGAMALGATGLGIAAATRAIRRK